MENMLEDILAMHDPIHTDWRVHYINVNCVL